MLFKSRRRTLITGLVIEKCYLFEKVENMKIKQSCCGETQIRLSCKQRKVAHVAKYEGILEELFQTRISVYRPTLICYFYSIAIIKMQRKNAKIAERKSDRSQNLKLFSSRLLQNNSYDLLPFFSSALHIPLFLKHQFQLIPLLCFNPTSINIKLMGLKKDFILSGAYFLILSTVLQAEDAFVFYRDSQNQTQKDMIKNSRGKLMIAFTIFSAINYLTLVLAPYFNCSIQKLSMAACAVLLIKYGCELASQTKILAIFFELGALFADIIGTGLFYLSSIRVVQILIDRYDLRERSGLCYGGAVGLYALSILLGYALGYMFFEETPVWMFLIALTTMTMFAAGIAYFTFVFSKLPVEEQQANQSNNNPPAVQNDNANAAGQGNGERFQLLRGGVTFNHILKFTLTTYKKIMPLFGVQTMFGTLIAYGYALLQFLIWTSQTESAEYKLQHNKDTMIIYSLGGIFTACLIGFICDRLPIRTLGYGLLVYNGLSLSFLYFAIYIKYFYTTLILFMFLGMTEFAILVWLLSACSRLYKGIFQVLAANSQMIAVAASAYGLGTIFFAERMNPQTKLSLELAALLVMNLIAFFFIKKLPTESVTIEYLVQELEENAEPAARPQRENNEIERREAPVQIELTYQKETMENKIARQQTIDPQNLL